MADWTTNIEFPLGSILTSAKMEQLRDNIEAVTENAEGAPEIVSAALADYPWGAEDLRNSSIRRLQLSTGTGSATGTLAANGTATITLDPYYFSLTVTASTTWVQVRAAGGPADVDSPKILLLNTDADFTTTYDVRWRYITVT